MPVSTTVCGLPLALSLISNCPWIAIALGVNVTEIAHEPPGARAPATGQLLVCVNPAGELGEPKVAIDSSCTGPPAAVSVTVSGLLDCPAMVSGNVSFGGTIWSVGGTPVPVSDTFCGLCWALSVIVSVSVCVGYALGRNATRILQEAPGAKTPQVEPEKRNEVGVE